MLRSKKLSSVKVYWLGVFESVGIGPRRFYFLKAIELSKYPQGELSTGACL